MPHSTSCRTFIFYFSIFNRIISIQICVENRAKLPFITCETILLILKFTYISVLILCAQFLIKSFIIAFSNDIRAALKLTSRFTMRIWIYKVIQRGGKMTILQRHFTLAHEKRNRSGSLLLPTQKPAIACDIMNYNDVAQQCRHTAFNN